MQDNPPTLKRQKYDIVRAVDKCLYCGAKQHNSGNCPRHAPISPFMTEYQQLQTAAEDAAVDMEDIERRLRKLETRLTACLQEDNTHAPPQRAPPIKAPQASDQSTLSLTSSGINITTSLTEPHHFVKLLVSGINVTLVQQKAAQVFSRGIDLVGPGSDNPNNAQGISNLAIDNEDPEELVWFDMVLATRYPMCFLVYQMVEKDRLVEWVSPTFIDGLKGQVKLEHSLLAKAVRAFVYNHEKVSAHHDHVTATTTTADPLRHTVINPNRGAFFFQQAQELLELCYMSSSRTTIRALLHMYMYQVMTPYGHHKAVQYSDLAIRMALVLKLNTERGMLVNEQIREDDRRLWWSTLWVHLGSCVSFHRPMIVSASEIMAPGARYPSKRQDETSQVGYCIDHCVNSAKLLLMSFSIGKRLCAETTEARLLWEIKDIEHQLDAWSLALPEALQPRFWTHIRNDPALDDDDTGSHHDGDGSQVHAHSTRALAVEIGLLLQGQWAMTKMQVYECFATNDSSILNLLMVRNRLHAAVDFTNHLTRSMEHARPCLIMYLLTLTEPSLTALIDLTKYEHSVDVVQQAVRQLSMLKTAFQAAPFSNDATAQSWVLTIDGILSTHSEPATTRVDQPTTIPPTTTLMYYTQDTQLQYAHHQSASNIDPVPYNRMDPHSQKQHEWGLPLPSQPYYYPFLQQQAIEPSPSFDNTERQPQSSSAALPRLFQPAPPGPSAQQRNPRPSAGWPSFEVYPGHSPTDHPDSHY